MAKYTNNFYSHTYIKEIDEVLLQADEYVTYDDLLCNPNVASNPLDATKYHKIKIGYDYEGIRKAIGEIKDYLLSIGLDFEYKNGVDSTFGFKYPRVNSDPLAELREMYESDEILSRMKADELKDIVLLMAGLFPTTMVDKALKQDRMLSLTYKNANKNGALPIAPSANNGLRNVEMLFDIYKATKSRKVIAFDYEAFEESTKKIVLHPYLLKEYLGRWYIIGLDEQDGRVRRFPLDRIKSTPIIQAGIKYKKCDIDIAAAFSRIIGVSKALNEEEKEEKIVIRIDRYQYDYTSTKKIHPTQKLIENHPLADANHFVLSIYVVPNYELEQLLLSFGEHVEVISPEPLRNRIEARLRDACRVYK